MKKIISLLSTILLASTICSAQVQYCGGDNFNLLVAKSYQTNQIIRSEEFDNAAWTKGAVTVTANSTVAPDGTTTADTVTVTAGAASHAIYNATPLVVTDGLAYRLSTFVHAGTSPYVKLRSLSPSTANINVNLTTGTIVAADISVLTSSILRLPNGWYKIELTYIQVGTDAYLLIYPTDSGYNTSYTALGTETIIVWGAQLNLASEPSDYRRTSSASSSLGPQCTSGTSQSLIDPSRCFVVTTGNPLKLTPFQGNQTGTNIDINQSPLTPYRGSSN